MGMSFSKIRVAVLRGGPSSAYEVSLKTGAYVLSLLREMSDVYEPIDIFISKDGEWHLSGLVHEPHKALGHTDVVWNALHGSYGEDGQVQRVLEGLQIPFTGSSAVASALAMNKDMAKHLYQKSSLLTSAYELIVENNLNEDRLINIFRNYLHPVIVKPANASGSLGVSLAHTFNELKQKITETFVHSPRVLVEEFIKGDEVSCTVIEGARGESIYALLPSSKSQSKLKVEENLPRLGEAGKQIEEMAKQAHKALGLSHYSSSDFIVTPKRKIYILETNSLPVFHKDSLTHHSLHNTGWRSRDFVDHVIKLAM